MASAEAGPPSQLIPATGRLATFAYRFPLPAARLVKFSDCFDGSLGVPNTAALVSSMDRARHDLVHELASGTPSYDNAAAAAKRYVPLIGSTLYSLEQATDPVYLKKPMVFEWCSGIGDPPRTNWMSNQAVVWDKCMSLACEALSRADSVCGSGVDSLGYASAATQLRTAAGIFEHLRKEELPRWVGETSKVERPPEVVEGICEGLSMYCLAEAQMMAVGKSIKGGTAPPSLIAKLCLGVVSQLEACVSTLRSKGGTYYSHLGRPFLTHITFQLQLFRALTYKHLADDAWSKDKYGLSIKHMKEAIDLVKERETAASRGVPMMEGGLEAEAESMNILRKEWNSLLAARVKDNNSVYYDPVPRDLEALPPPSVIVKAIPFEIPQITLMHFAKDPPQQPAEEKASEGAARSAEAPSAPSAPAPDK